jgi:hypothetical protein
VHVLVAHAGLAAGGQSDTALQPTHEPVPLHTVPPSLQAVPAGSDAWDGTPAVQTPIVHWPDAAGVSLSSVTA